MLQLLGLMEAGRAGPLKRTSLSSKANPSKAINQNGREAALDNMKCLAWLRANNLLAVWLWEIHVISLNLGFLGYGMERMALCGLLCEPGKPGVQSPRVSAVPLARLLSLGSRSPSLSKPAHFKLVTSNNVLE